MEAQLLDYSIRTNSAIQLIERAFDGVPLSDGISLLEAYAITFRMSMIQRKLSRNRDEQTDWKKISGLTLEKYADMLPVLDSRGALFHLPAYMRYLIANHQKLHRSNTEHVVILSLIPNEDNKEWFMDRYASFNTKQREAIVTFLHWKLIKTKDDQYAESIHKALAYWQYT